MLPLVAEGSIRLILLCSGDVLMARLRHTTDRDGDHAYQLLRPRLVRLAADASHDAQPTIHLNFQILSKQTRNLLKNTLKNLC